MGAAVVRARAAAGAAGVWYHSDVVRPALQYALFYAPLARFVYGRARRIIVSSPALARACGARSRRTGIACPCHSVRHRPGGRGRAVADRAGRADVDAEPFVLFAGRHVAYKGVDVLLRALARDRRRAR